MLETIEALKDANVPTILTIAGVILILLAIGVEGVIKLPAHRQRHAAITGTLLLGLGVALFVLLMLQPPPAAPLVEVTPSTSTPTAPGAATSEPATVTSTSPPPTSAPTGTMGSVSEPPAARPDWEVKVEPAIARHYVGSAHEVFVTVRDLNGLLIVGETVYLRVVDGPHTGLALELQTNEAGQGVFRYTGTGAGTDTIRVWAGAVEYETLPDGMRAEITHEWLAGG